MTCYLVLGTGRSGTSLAMQALAALGVAVPGEQVPASENNLRGTGEAIEFRDQCRQLHEALGLFAGFRPDGWAEVSAAHAARKWLADFLTHAGADDNRPIALKFPLSGLFLPLWQQAAQEVGCELRLIWATRGAGQVMRSLISAYDTPPTRAAQVWAQRSYYLLRDAPDDTLLLPFEGWANDTSAQIDALAGLTGAQGDARSQAEAQFSARLDHSAAAVAPMRADVQAVADAVDAMLAERRGPLGELIARDDPTWLENMTALGDLIGTLVPREPFSTDAVEMRLRWLARLDEIGDRSARMDEELGILSDRVKSLAAENRALRKLSPPTPVALATTPVQQEVAAAELAEKRAEIERLVAIQQDLEGELRMAQEHLAAEAEKFSELRTAYQHLTVKFDRLEEETEGRYRQRLNLADRRDVNQTRRLEQFAATRERLNKRIELLEANNKALKSRRDRPTNCADVQEQQANAQKAATREMVRQQPAPAVYPDATVEQQIATLEHDLECARLEASRLARQLHLVEQENDYMVNSRSWRITRPLRAVLSRMHR